MPDPFQRVTLSSVSNFQISDPPAPATTTSYTANALNQYQGTGAITGAMTAAPTFDDDGNATAYPMPADASANATLTWDAENRLVKVVMPNSGPTITYDYDYLSRRVSRSVGVSPATSGNKMPDP